MTGKADLVGRSLLEIDDLDSSELELVLERAVSVKADRLAFAESLKHKSVALIFEKPSTRTRISLERAVSSCGGHPIILSTSELQLGRGETVSDTAKVVGRYVDAITARVFRHGDLESLREDSGRPVINALSDRAHPLQALADLMTLRERGARSVVYLGDGNNVAHSLMLGCAMAGIDFSAATPKSYGLDEEIVDRAEAIAASTGSSVACFDDPKEAAQGGDALYTDVWVSMGDEETMQQRVRALRPYQLNADVLSAASDGAIVMHCLPAHRGEEITSEVIDGPQSVVFDQAENRLHTARALLTLVLGGMQ